MLLYQKVTVSVSKYCVRGRFIVIDMGKIDETSYVAEGAGIDVDFYLEQSARYKKEKHSKNMDFLL